MVVDSSLQPPMSTKRMYVAAEEEEGPGPVDFAALLDIVQQQQAQDDDDVDWGESDAEG